MIIQKTLDEVGATIHHLNKLDSLGLEPFRHVSTATRTIWGLQNCAVIAQVVTDSTTDLNLVTVKWHTPDEYVLSKWKLLFAEMNLTAPEPRGLYVHEDDAEFAKITEPEWKDRKRHELRSLIADGDTLAKEVGAAWEAIVPRVNAAKTRLDVARMVAILTTERATQIYLERFADSPEDFVHGDSVLQANVGARQTIDPARAQAGEKESQAVIGLPPRPPKSGEVGSSGQLWIDYYHAHIRAAGSRPTFKQLAIWSGFGEGWLKQLHAGCDQEICSKM